MDVEKKHKFPYLQEAAKITGILAILYWISLLSFNQSQVDAIKHRDRGKCQYPGCQNKTKYKVEVHHIVPQGYAIRVNNMRPDTPFNAVCLCEEHHVGYPKDGRQQEKGMAWDPRHPDTYLVHLVLVGKYHLLPQRLKDSLNQSFPGLVEYYEQVNADKKNKNVSMDDMFNVVMRKWRSDQLDNRRIYWNSNEDGNLQVAAITATLNALRRRWRFPLRMLGGRVKDINRGQYAWDNLAALAIEKYVTSLSRNEVSAILRELKEAGSESRIVYYNKIYSPAVEQFENTSNMAGMLNHYIISLPESEIKALTRLLDNAKNKKDVFNIYMRELYEPALALHSSHQADYMYANSGQRSRHKENQRDNGGSRGGLKTY